MRTAAIIGGFFALFLATFAVVGFLKQRSAEDRDRIAYQNQIDACERGNVLRRIVFSPTSPAVEENAGTRIGRVYADNLDAMLQTEGVHPRTGAVTCTEVIQAP